MIQSDNRKSFLFHKPGNYRIQVIGCLDESWSGTLCNFRITACTNKDHYGSVTELFGKVRDQAELAGLLNNLYELHLTLLSVEYLEKG